MALRAADITPEIAALLARAMYPNPVRIARALEQYRHEPGRKLFVWEVNGRAVCAAGVRQDGKSAELLHIGSDPAHAGKGYGRALVHALLDTLELDSLSAETDDSAAGFYRKAGFEIEEIPSGWDTRRYRCTLRR